MATLFFGLSNGLESSLGYVSGEKCRGCLEFKALTLVGPRSAWIQRSSPGQRLLLGRHT